VRLLERAARIPIEDQAISSVTLGELVYGAHRRPDITEIVLERVGRVIADTLVLPFDEEAAHRYGELRAELECAGTPIGEADTRIASIALVHGLTVVTGKVRHFERVPALRVENWLA
jgi:tRNA(fMet)-specific endonuclease VapC